MRSLEGEPATHNGSAAIQAAAGRDYLPMQVLFESAIARSSGQ